MTDLITLFSAEWGQLFPSLVSIFFYLQIILHVLFAGAVARDASEFLQYHGKPILVSPLIWAFATLVGGVTVAAIYWLLHHSKLTRHFKSDN